MAKVSPSKKVLREAGFQLSGLLRFAQDDNFESPGLVKSPALLQVGSLVQVAAANQGLALGTKCLAIEGRAEFPGGHIGENLLTPLSESLSKALSLLAAGNSAVDCVISDRLDFRLRLFETAKQGRHWLKQTAVQKNVAPARETPYVQVVDEEVQHPISKPDAPSLTKLFQQLSAVDLSQLPVELLDEHEVRLKEARLLQAKAMIGVSFDQKLTLSKVNQFLKRHANQKMDDQSAVLLSRLISNLRSTEHRKLIFDNDGQPVECVLTSVFRGDQGTRRFQLFGLGGSQNRYWQRAALPPGLHLE